MARKSSSVHLEGRTWDIIDRFKKQEGLSSRNIALELIIDRWSRGDIAPKHITEPTEKAETSSKVETTEEEENPTEAVFTPPTFSLNSNMLGSIFAQMEDIE